MSWHLLQCNLQRVGSLGCTLLRSPQELIVRLGISLNGTKVNAATASLYLGFDAVSRPMNASSSRACSAGLPSKGVKEIMQIASADSFYASLTSSSFSSSRVNVTIQQ